MEPLKVFKPMPMNMRERLTDEFFVECRSILEKKGKDYSPDDEAFGEIIKMARATNTSPEQVMFIYMFKHWSAIQSYVKRGRVESEEIHGRLSDLANYAALMSAFIKFYRSGTVNGKSNVEIFDDDYYNFKHGDKVKLNPTVKFEEINEDLMDAYAWTIEQGVKECSDYVVEGKSFIDSQIKERPKFMKLKEFPNRVFLRRLFVRV